MIVSEHIDSLKNHIEAIRSRGGNIGFVPTMGALHPGHISLINRAKDRNEVVIASIFVNPTQFNQISDHNLYPRTLKEDLALLEAAGCDIAFVPSVSEIYPDGPVRGHWDFGLLSSVLEGHFRPGHFDGVLTVVRRLFEIVTPDTAYFGEKDFQQLANIRELVRRESIPVEIVSCPTRREEDGLAMSSRNTRLNPSERTLAAHIPRILAEMKSRVSEFDPPSLEQWGRAEFHVIAGIKLEYLEIVDGGTFAPVAEWADSEYPVILCALYVGEVRLIDNVILRKTDV